jgi:hypothetical protein
MVLSSPFRCCEARQWSVAITTVASCRATIRWALWAAEDEGNFEEAKSQPMAEVLSPSARMHS